jgi:hypothetical protein
VSRLTIVLIRENESAPEYTARYDVRILDADGQPMPFDRDSGDLIPHLSPSQLAAAKNFIDSLWQKAKNEFIGTN